MITPPSERYRPGSQVGVPGSRLRLCRTDDVAGGEVGACVGSKDGTRVGISVGKSVVAVFGNSVGYLVGSATGICVSPKLGTSVGKSVGTDGAGCSVGTRAAAIDEGSA